MRRGQAWACARRKRAGRRRSTVLPMGPLLRAVGSVAVFATVCAVNVAIVGAFAYAFDWPPGIRELLGG